MSNARFSQLEAFLQRVPGINGAVGTGTSEDGTWWVKFTIDIDDPLAWNVVQEFGNVLNLLSVNEQLPTIFKPVSPPSYLNGGPRESLSWVIESATSDFTPTACAKRLEMSLPSPVEDRSQWSLDDADDE